MEIKDLYFQLPKKPFTWKKVEAQFTTRLFKKIKDNWWHAWKLSDMDIRKKPYDWLIVYGWLDAKVEVKQSSNKKSVDLFKMLLPNQVVWLSRVQENLGLSLVIYYNNFHHKYWIIEFSKETKKMKINF